MLDEVKILERRHGKLYLGCIIVGVLTGLVVSLYRWVLHYVGEFRVEIVNFAKSKGIFYFFLLWILFITIGLINDYVTKKYPKISGSGIPQVKGILLKKIEYFSWFREIIAKFATGFLAIGTGLSLGREGPSVQLGSYMGYGLTEILKGDEVEKRYLVTSGACAGLVGAFGAPLAGVIFAVEELHKFVSAKLLICTLLASIMSDFVGRQIFGLQTAFNLLAIYPKAENPYFQLGLYIILGIIIAVFGKIFTMILLKSQDVFKMKKIPKFIKISVVMLMSLMIAYFLPDVNGGGHKLVEDLLSGYTIDTLVIIFVAKLLFTAFSYSTGVAGGIFLPILVLGAILGKIFGIGLVELIGLNPEFVPHYIILGMVGYFVAVVRAPITGVVLILEMTGNFEHLLSLIVVSAVAYFVTELLKLEPIYDIFYERMAKDIPEDLCTKKVKRSIITIPVMAESYLDGKKLCDIDWGEHVLVVTIIRGERTIIPRGSVEIMSGDILEIIMPEEKAIELNEYFYKQGTI